MALVGRTYNRHAMRICEIDEFELIEILSQTVKSREVFEDDRLSEAEFSLVQSIGDDAAIWQCGAGTSVLTTDTVVEGVHFDLSHISWRDLGWKSLAVNLSDIAAMGCKPKVATVTLGLYPDIEVSDIVDMYEGMLDASSMYGGLIVGGDIVRSPTLFVTIAMTGYLGDIDSPLLMRSAAIPGDVVAVTGNLGTSAGGLKIISLDLPKNRIGYSSLLESHFRPVPRVLEGLEFRNLGIRAAIDVSDGLINDLGRMCKASGVGAIIKAEQVPISNDLKQAFDEEWLVLALAGGEDYELLVTAPEEIIRKAQDIIDTPITIIGKIVDGDAVEVLDEFAAVVEIDGGGWDHFACG